MFDILKATDQIKFTMLVPTLVVPPIMAPIPLIGKGHVMIMGSKVCVQGDELPKSISTPLPYTDGSFTIPGTGKINLVLPPSHLSKVFSDLGKKVLVRGPPFQATFAVNSPAQQPNPPAPNIPDPVASKPLQVQYISTNVISDSV